MWHSVRLPIKPNAPQLGWPRASQVAPDERNRAGHPGKKHLEPEVYVGLETCDHLSDGCKGWYGRGVRPGDVGTDHQAPLNSGMTPNQVGW